MDLFLSLSLLHYIDIIVVGRYGFDHYFRIVVDMDLFLSLS